MKEKSVQNSGEIKGKLRENLNFSAGTWKVMPQPSSSPSLSSWSPFPSPPLILVWLCSLGSGNCSHSEIFYFPEIHCNQTGDQGLTRSIWEWIKTKALREYSLFKCKKITLKKKNNWKIEKSQPSHCLGKNFFFPGSFYTPALGLCQIQTRSKQQNFNLDKRIPCCGCLNTNRQHLPQSILKWVSINCIFIPAFHYFSNRKEMRFFFGSPCSWAQKWLSCS